MPTPHPEGLTNFTPERMAGDARREFDRHTETAKERLVEAIGKATGDSGDDSVPPVVAIYVDHALSHLLAAIEVRDKGLDQAVRSSGVTQDAIYNALVNESITVPASVQSASEKMNVEIPHREAQRLARTVKAFLCGMPS